MKANTPVKLSAFQVWMVASNLKAIRAGTPKKDRVALLRANGYAKVADAVENRSELTRTLTTG